jgi:pimeloyl-ACP methyl ester carboxylesterase
MRKILLVVLAALVLAVVGFVAWASITNPVMPEAAAALQSDPRVQVDTHPSGGNWIVFQPAGIQPDTGLIFYPGGKVNYQAYAPYARAVASQGFLVVIAHMPLNLAVLDAGEAGNVMRAYPQISYWAVGGHSLGGSMAANFAFKHPGQVSGLVLLASYPASSDDLSQADLRVVSIYGTLDGVADGGKIEASRALLPPQAEFVTIKGGNHAQFGDYGAQAGDQPAEISRAAQQGQAVAATRQLLESLSK